MKKALEGLGQSLARVRSERGYCEGGEGVFIPPPNNLTSINACLGHLLSAIPSTLVNYTC